MESTIILSVVLATDGLPTVQAVLDAFAKQTIRDAIEIVLVTPRGAVPSSAVEEVEGFAAVRVVEVDSLVPLGVARAAAVRTARAELVFIGETHTYPEPQCMERLVEAHRAPWGVVVPAIGNANPDGPLSWAGLMSDYGAWTTDRPAGEIEDAPLANVVYRRAALVALGDGLAWALSHGDQMLRTLRAHGHRAFFEPRARIDHANITSVGPWVADRFLHGMILAANRAVAWSLGRRAAYVVAGPLIALVLLRRLLPPVWTTVRRHGLPAGTTACVVLATLVKTAGEMVGYATGPTDALERGVTEYEVGRLAYVPPR